MARRPIDSGSRSGPTRGVGPSAIRTWNWPPPPCRRSIHPRTSPEDDPEEDDEPEDDPDEDEDPEEDDEDELSPEDDSDFAGLVAVPPAVVSEPDARESVR